MKAIILMIFAFASFILIGVTAHADMYQSTNDEGSVLYTNIPASGSKVMVKEKEPARKSVVTAANNKSRTGGEFHSIVEEKSKKHNVDPKLVKAVIKAESNWNPMAVSNKGAVGMMQLMPKTASDLGVGNRFNPAENIEGGVKYLRYLLDKFNGNLSLALAAYNAGPARVEKVNGVPSIPETVNYVKRVMNEYSGGPGWSTGGSGNTKIRMVVLEDGTVLFTNAFNTGHSYLSN
jgi:soluble lytic murein transglycosylase-like protein